MSFLNFLSGVGFVICDSSFFFISVGLLYMQLNSYVSFEPRHEITGYLPW